MIKISADEITVSMGTGDIGVNTGSIIHNESKEIVGSFVRFRELSTTQPIGEPAKSYKDDPSVYLSFTNPASIDVVIKHLLIAKERLEDLNT